jgi:hypothetical protein
MRTTAILLCLAAASAAQDPGARDPTGQDSFAAQRDAIVPKGEELSWHAVPWRPELRTALAEADREGKPVLLWAMNGHPLGQC